MSNETLSLTAEFKRWVEQEGAWQDALPFSPGEKKETALTSGASTAVFSEARRNDTLVEQPVVAVSAPVIAPIKIAEQDTEEGKDKAKRLEELYARYKGCQVCALGATRIKLVFGVGAPNARVLFIGEGPGYEEDRRGEPFVGKAGQLLDKILSSIGLSRAENVYIANIVKCHPMTNPQTPEARGNDRAPTPDEVEACSPILQEQVAILRPRVIVTLGSPSSKAVLRTTDGITKLRGRLFPFPIDTFFASTRLGSAAPSFLDDAARESLGATQILPTYHPAALLRNPDLKRDVWTDMKLLRTLLMA